ncbi:major facilitator superfamily domain-containing protein [Talaromyces proteolyticus]|uniref:Major facilitator superfamily domain-containing protein n=1 Tax=Talaromyces proteolyticus TaxID=1131652 RepID=A0AAD4KQ91_9EURO|nr:major facilitator superfamily domain-containing protein [Talaromyces proteolyticus]KAH8697897.1 major facilitator superfamily domain-containing protein [Talaromyces proteolyticus]
MSPTMEKTSPTTDTSSSSNNDDHAGDNNNAKLAPENIQQQALAVLNDSPESRARERAYMRKLDCIILPTISALYFFEYIDRGNIANAKLLGISEGHDTAKNGVGPGTESLNSTQWQTVVMIFYVGLVLFQVPGCLGYRVFPPSKTATFNLAGLLVCRIMLGVFEGLFGTGIVYYLSLWYRRDELGMRVFWFLGPTAVAGAFGGLISYGVGHINSHVQNWQLLFIIEGIPGFLLGAFCLYWLPDRPLKNSRFTEEQSEVAIARYRRDAYDRAGKIQKKHVIWTLTDWKLTNIAAIYIPTAALLSSISGFLPTLVQNLGYKTSASANLMTVPPYACAFALMYITSYTSDRFRDRGWHIVTLSVVAAVAYVCLATLGEDKLHAKYGMMCVAVACVYSTYPPTHAWTANNFGNETKRAIGMGIYTSIGNLGSIAGSFFFPSTQGPQFRQGHWVCFAMSVATAFISLVNHLLLARANRKRDEKYGKPDKDIVIDVSEEADRNVMFRFIT